MTTLTAFVLTLQVTLGGGGAIAIGSESYGEVHWPCPDPALATINQDPSKRLETGECSMCDYGQLNINYNFLQGFKIS